MERGNARGATRKAGSLIAEKTQLNASIAAKRVTLKRVAGRFRANEDEEKL